MVNFSWPAIDCAAIMRKKSVWPWNHGDSSVLKAAPQRVCVAKISQSNMFLPVHWLVFCSQADAGGNPSRTTPLPNQQRQYSSAPAPDPPENRTERAKSNVDLSTLSVGYEGLCKNSKTCQFHNKVCLPKKLMLVLSAVMGKIKWKSGQFQQGDCRKKSSYLGEKQRDASSMTQFGLAVSSVSWLLENSSRRLHQLTVQEKHLDARQTVKMCPWNENESEFRPTQSTRILCLPQAGEQLVPLLS